MWVLSLEVAAAARRSMAKARWTGGKTWKLLKRVGLGVALLLAVALGYLWLRPVHGERLSANAHPLADYTEALQRFRQRDSPERKPLAEAGKSLVFSHGRKTERVIVLLHGYTRLPETVREPGTAVLCAGLQRPHSPSAASWPAKSDDGGAVLPDGGGVSRRR